MRFVLLIVSIVSVSCTSNSLHSDYSLSPLDSNYHSALIKVKSQTFFGVGVAEADDGYPITFSVQGVYRGTIRVSSNECKYDESKYYENSEDVNFTTQMLGERCLFAITVMPHFTIEESKGVQWRGISGALLLRRGYRNSTLKVVRDESDKIIPIKIPSEPNSDLFLSGCGQNIKKSLIEPYSLNLAPSRVEKDCVIDGFYRTEREANPFVIYVSLHSPDFMKLSQPRITIMDNALKVDTESAVSFMSFQSQQVFKNFFIFNYEPRTRDYLTLYTTKGRVVYCQIGGFGGAICLN